MHDAIITISGLVKNYGRVAALDGLTLDVPAGAVGLLGPNGAGKTTLIKLLLGLLPADAGRALITGFDPSKRKEQLELRRRVGYMPEGDCLLPGMSAVDLVMTLGRIAGLTWEDAMTRAHEVLDYVEIDEARYRDLTEYSTGMKQRVKLAQALVHDPPLILLDEPTNGLDPKGRSHMLDLVDDLAHNQQKNVLLCSHLLLDVERTCDHVVVLQRGKSVAQGVVAELTRSDASLLLISIQDGGHEAFAAELERDGRSFERDGEAFRISARDEVDDADEIFALALRGGVSISAVQTVRSSLEEVFLDALRESGDS